MTPDEALEMLLAGGTSGIHFLHNDMLNRHLSDQGLKPEWFAWRWKGSGDSNEAWCFICGRFLTSTWPMEQRIAPLASHRREHIEQLLKGELHVHERLEHPPPAP